MAQYSLKHHVRTIMSNDGRVGKITMSMTDGGSLYAHAFPNVAYQNKWLEDHATRTNKSSFTLAEFQELSSEAGNVTLAWGSGKDFQEALTALEIRLGEQHD